MHAQGSQRETGDWFGGTRQRRVGCASILLLYVVRLHSSDKSWCYNARNLQSLRMRISLSVPPTSISATMGIIIHQILRRKTPLEAVTVRPNGLVREYQSSKAPFHQQVLPERASNHHPPSLHAGLMSISLSYSKEARPTPSNLLPFRVLQSPHLGHKHIKILVTTANTPPKFARWVDSFGFAGYERG